MKDYVLVINYENCTGCRICETACSIKNAGETNPSKSRVRIVKIEGEADVTPIPILCMKCVEPACKAVCPMGAISDDPSTGARVIDKDKCIGCSACVYACPFGAITVDRSEGRSFTCHQCEGDPTCAKFCPTETIRYLHRDEVGMKLRRARLDKYVTFVRGQSEEES